MGDIHVVVGRREAVFFSLVLALLLSSVFVVSYGEANPVVVGHADVDVANLDAFIPVCAAGQYLTKTGPGLLACVNLPAGSSKSLSAPDCTSYVFGTRYDNLASDTFLMVTSGWNGWIQIDEAPDASSALNTRLARVDARSVYGQGSEFASAVVAASRSFKVTGNGGGVICAVTLA